MNQKMFTKYLVGKLVWYSFLLTVLLGFLYCYFLGVFRVSQ